MRVVDEENAVYQGTTAYRIRLKYQGAHELLTLMRESSAHLAAIPPS